MYQDFTLKIGIAPNRRGISSNRKGAFTPEAALAIKNRIMAAIQSVKDEQVQIVNIDWLNTEGIMFDVSHADQVAAYFKKEGVDAIFTPHCNFGCEEAVGRLAKLMQKPVLLWGPRDERFPEDGSRATDTQCGLFASSRLMLRYGVPFTYIENCWLDDEAFVKGFQRFVAAATVVKTFRSLRIGQVNARPKYFTSVMFNESELIEKFGIEIVPINIAIVKQKIDSIMSERADEVMQVSENIGSRIDCTTSAPDWRIKTAALKLALLELAKVNQCTALATECWTITPQTLGVLPCFAMADLTDFGLPVTCEADVNGAITSLLLTAAARGKSPTFFGEYTMRHPEDDHGELIWHCGPFPHSLKKAGVNARLVNDRPAYEIRGGRITIARFDGDRGQYSLFAGAADGMEGPQTAGTYLWAKMDNWLNWEKKFIYGPYIHHVSGIHGDYADVLKEACRYIPGLAFDSPS